MVLLILGFFRKRIGGAHFIWDITPMALGGMPPPTRQVGFELKGDLTHVVGDMPLHLCSCQDRRRLLKYNRKSFLLRYVYYSLTVFLL